LTIGGGAASGGVGDICVDGVSGGTSNRQSATIAQSGCGADGVGQFGGLSMAAATALALAAAGASLYSALKKPKAPEVPALAPLPAAPDPALLAEQQGLALAKKRAKAATPLVTPPKQGTLLTGPAGLAAPALTAKKTLLGA
jgi:hypothetical protein